MNYTTPEFEIIAFDAEDVIATSEPTLEDVVELVWDEL